MRKKLTGPRTYYVRTDGNDSNDGLSNTSAGAFLTLQQSINNLVYNVDTQGNNVTVQLADGTYTGGMSISSQIHGGGALYINGNLSTPSNVLINMPTGSTGISTSGWPTYVQVSGFKINAPNAIALLANLGARLYFQNIDFGFCGTGGHILANISSLVQAIGNYSISGNAARHIDAQFISTSRVNNVTVTLTGTPAFSSNFADAYHISCIDFLGTTIVGSATGQRYNGTANSLIRTKLGDGNVNYFPGNSVGSANNGAIYV